MATSFWIITSRQEQSRYSSNGLYLVVYSAQSPQSCAISIYGIGRYRSVEWYNVLENSVALPDSFPAARLQPDYSGKAAMLHLLHNEGLIIVQKSNVELQSKIV